MANIHVQVYPVSLDIEARLQAFGLGLPHPILEDTPVGRDSFILALVSNISLLAASALIDSDKGQEASTRYMDFTKAEVKRGFNTDREKEFIDRWNAIYQKALEVLPPYMKEKYPKEYLLPPRTASDKVESTYEKTIKAITFDVASGFLPCGTATNAGWLANLRNAEEHLTYLTGHPLLEVRELAFQLYDYCGRKVPHSFRNKPRVLPKYADKIGNYYFNDTTVPIGTPDIEMSVRWDNQVPNSQMIEELDRKIHTFAEARKPFEPWPRYLNHLASFDILGALDFASYRDLQRHRRQYCPVPVVSTELGLSSWYLDEVGEASPELADTINALWLEQVTYANQIGTIQAQYALPMATLVPIDIQCSLGQFVYLTELRSSVAVRPPLRKFIHSIYHEITRYMQGFKAVTWVDTRGDYENSKRGDQDIIEK
jgi:hypothetical protein